MFNYYKCKDSNCLRGMSTLVETDECAYCGKLGLTKIDSKDIDEEHKNMWISWFHFIKED